MSYKKGDTHEVRSIWCAYVSCWTLTLFEQRPKTPPAFQGLDIPVHGLSVANLIRKRLQRDRIPSVPVELLPNSE